MDALKIPKGILLDTTFLILLAKRKMLSRFVEVFEGYLPDIVLLEFLKVEAYRGTDVREERELLKRMFVILRMNDEVIL